MGEVLMGAIVLGWALLTGLPAPVAAVLLLATVTLVLLVSVIVLAFFALLAFVYSKIIAK